MNETDRTSVGLLYHENIIDVLENFDSNYSILLNLLFTKSIEFTGVGSILFKTDVYIVE